MKRTLMKKARLLQLVLIVTIYLMIATALHEYSHMLALRLSGYEGYIKSTELNAVYFTTFPADPNIRLFVGAAGGVGASLVLLILYLMDVDPENHHAFKILIGYELIYGFFEGYGFYTDNVYQLMNGEILGTVFVMAYLIYHIMRRWVVVVDE